MAYERYIYTFGLALLGFTAASPAAKPNAFCLIVNGLVTLAHQEGPATKFCSSYLSVPLSTNTVTATITTTTAVLTQTTTSGTDTAIAPTVISTAGTATVTSPITITETETATSTTGTVTIAISITNCVTPGTPVKEKRAAKPIVAKPACFSAYAPGAALSSACTCLSITPSTTTVTTTLSQATTTIVTSSVAATLTTTPTLLFTSTLTEQPLVTETSTITISVDASSTSTGFAIPTFSVVVSGGVNNGRWFGLQSGSPPSIIDSQPQGSASRFSLNGDRLIASGAGGLVAVEAPGVNSNDPFRVYISGSGTSAVPNSSPLSCSISQNSDGTCPLTCVNFEGSSRNFDCNVFWRVGATYPTTPGLSCRDFTPLVVGSA